MGIIVEGLHKANCRVERRVLVHAEQIRLVGELRRELICVLDSDQEVDSSCLSVYSIVFGDQLFIEFVNIIELERLLRSRDSHRVCRLHDNAEWTRFCWSS